MIRQNLIAWLKNVSCWRSHKAPASSPESTGCVSARQPLGKGDHRAFELFYTGGEIGVQLFLSQARAEKRTMRSFGG